MKKFLSIILMIVMALSIALVAVGCNDNGDKNTTTVDTFNGAISDESYDTEQEAVEEFLATELSGEAMTANLVEYNKKSDLSQDQIKELNTSDELNENDEIVSAQVVQVKYKKEAGEVSAASEETEYSVFTIYIIEISPNGKTTHEFRYYVPKASNGDVLTRSYFEDLFDSDKYKNFTQECKTTTSANAQGVTMNVALDYTIKLANDKASLNMHTANTGVAIPGAQNMEVLGYFEYSDGNFNMWLSQDNGATYEKTSVGNIGSLEITDMDSFADLSLPQLDYSYYEKTDYGFKIQDGYISKYVNKAFAEMGFSTNVNAELLFYVKEGRLDKMVTNVSGTVQGAVAFTANQEVVFSNFGSTTVTKPATIKDNA